MKAKVNKLGPKQSGVRGRCWLWTGHVNKRGYGVFSLDGRKVYVHRFSWVAANGPIPEGLTIDHLCCVKTCVRPSHLEPVTLEENYRREVERRRACSKGHPRTAGSRYANGKCRQCVQESHRAKYAKDPDYRERSAARYQRWKERNPGVAAERAKASRERRS